MIFAAKSRDVIDVFIRFAGDKNPVLAKHVWIGSELPFVARQPLQNVEQERHPSGGRFNETKFEPGKLLGDLVGDEISESKQRLHSAVAEGMIAFDVEQIQKSRAAGPCVNANRQFQIVGGFIDRKQIRVVESPGSLNAAEEDTDSAVVLSPFQFFDGFVDGLERWNYRPLYAATRFCAGLSDKAVVCAANGNFQDRIIRNVDQKQGGKDHLSFDVELIHVL